MYTGFLVAAVSNIAFPVILLDHEEELYIAFVINQLTYLWEIHRIAFDAHSLRVERCRLLRDLICPVTTPSA